MEVMLEMSVNPPATNGEPPPLQFNFASWLFGLNQHRANKPAYIDDLRTTTCGQLEER